MLTHIWLLRSKACLGRWRSERSEILPIGVVGVSLVSAEINKVSNVL